MAEALEIVGVIANIIALIGFSLELYDRIDDAVSLKDVPKAFRDIRNILPLLLTNLRQTEQSANSGSLDQATLNSLLSVVQGCQSKITTLQGILENIMPKEGSSRWRAGWKAVTSVKQDSKVKTLEESLMKDVQTLTNYHAAHGATASQADSILLAVSSLNMNPKKNRSGLFSIRYDTETSFVGRDGIIKDMWVALDGKNRVALAGLGGSGKTRIAIEFCHEWRSEHPDTNIFWIHSTSRPRFYQAYWEIAKAFEIPGINDPQINVLKLVSDWLSIEENGNWLMILDNADDEDLWLGQNKSDEGEQRQTPLINYIPRNNHGRVIITTRYSQLGWQLALGRTNLIEIPLLKPEHAANLLLNKTSDLRQSNEEDAKKLVELLGCLPLAITQAAAYLVEIDISVSEYLELYSANDTEIWPLIEKSSYDPARDHESENSVFKTWKISFDQIMKKFPRAGDILSLIAVLDRQAIPESLLQNPNESILEFKGAVAKLKAFSLVQVHQQNKALSVHRLVHLSTQKWLEQEGRLHMWQERGLRTLYQACPQSGDYKNWNALERLYPHLVLVLSYKFDDKSLSLQRTKILHTLGRYSRDHGRYKLAHQQLSESLDIRSRYLKPDDPQLLECIDSQAWVLGDLMEYDNTLELWQRSYDQRRKTLGEDHLDTLVSLDGIAYILACPRGPRNLAEAEEIRRKLLASRKRQLGPDHEVTVDSMSGLAYVLGCYAKNDGPKLLEAERIHRECLNIRERTMGPVHPSTLASSTCLMRALQQLGKYEEAEKYARSSYLGRKQILGPDHPRVHMILKSLVNILKSQGKDKEACEIEECLKGVPHELDITPNPVNLLDKK